VTITAEVGTHRIAKNTLLLLLAQIGSRAVAIVYVAALARYVGADGIGKISAATALVGIVVLILAPGLDALLVRDVAVDTDKATGYVSNMMVSRLFLGIPFLMLVMIVANVAAYSADIMPIIFVYALVYLFDSLGEILISLFRAFQRMEYDAGTQVARDLINFSLSLLAIYLHLPLLAIVFMSFVAQACKLVLMLVLSIHRFVRPPLAVSLRTMKTLFVSSLPFGGLVVLYTIQGQLGTLVLSLSHPPETVGTFAAANTLITTLMLVPGAISVAIFPALSKLHVRAPGDLPRHYALVYKYLLILGFPLGLGTMLVGDQVIFLIYGHGFEGSVIVLRVLAPFLFTFVTYCNGPLLYATGRERFFAQTLALAVCAYGLLCFLLIPRWGSVGAAIAFVTTSVVTTSTYSVACHRLLKLSLPWITIGKVALATVLMGLVTFIAQASGMNWLVVTLLVAPSCYIGLLFLLKLVKRDELQNFVGLPGFR
jgi:O-antigen/teichoic acid export membrane protein